MVFPADVDQLAALVTAIDLWTIRRARAAGYILLCRRLIATVPCKRICIFAFSEHGHISDC
ncbi:MAG: hypothetical protein QOJ84_3511 [Bradyrhizobium sp.]|nr:hypothetical protein [Bradyrhizobium sp.]